MPPGNIRPPDLEMRVRAVAEHGRTRLSYTLDSPTGAVNVSHREIAGPVFQGSPQDFQTYLLHKVEHLLHRQDVDGSWLVPEELDRKLAGLGRDLWRELIPPEIHHAYRQIRRSVRSWMIISDEPWIPWELIKPYDASLPEDVIDDDFLALRFELTRWLAGDKTPAQEIAVRQLAIFRTAKDLPHTRQERTVLQDLARSCPDLLDASPAVDSAGAVLSCLETRDLHLLHFVGHGTHAATQPEESAIPFPDTSVLRPVDLEGPLATRIGRTRPLVFLNACSAGQQGWSLTRLGGWAARWVSVCGCGAFVAPLWPVKDKSALAFAEAFYGALARGATLGEASLAARRHVVKVRPGDPSTLAYTIYGHPNARLSFGGAAAPSPVAIPASTASPGPVGSLGVPVASPKREERLRHSPQRRRWRIGAVLGGVLLVGLLVSTSGHFELAGWMERRQGTEPASDVAASQGRSPVEPPAAAGKDRKPQPVGARAAPPARSELASMFSSPGMGTAGKGTAFEITAAPGAPKAALTRSLQDAASPLAEMDIKGWTLQIDVDAPRIAAHTQDGFPWQSCRLLAHCRARRQGTSLDLGTVPAVNSQVDGATACEGAAETLGKDIIYQFVTSLRREKHDSH
jgi:hypothetical protein